MFGVVPKSIWNKSNPADEHNLCTWAMRCLLIEDQHRLILIDNGIGNKQSQKFFSYYFLHGNESLLSSLHNLSFTPEDITDNLLTHLHFDHCGGGFKRSDHVDSKIIPTFPKAKYWVHEDHWKWAIQPNQREKASFLKENLLPMKDSGQLYFLPETHSPFDDFELLFVDGHTRKQTIPHIKYKGKTIVFVADLIPSVGHIPLPYIMSYDTQPLLTLEEKSRFLNVAAEEEFVLFFEHDPVNECCTVQKTEAGIRVKDIFLLKDI